MEKKEIIMTAAELIPAKEDVERICDAGQRRRSCREALLLREKRRAEESEKQNVAKVCSRIFALAMLALAVASATAAGWWAAVAPVILSLLALESTR